MAAAAVLPNANDPIPIRKPKPAAPAPATTRRASRATVAILLVCIAVNFAVTVRRVHDDRGAVAFVCFSYLNLALLICALHRAQVAPQGSPAHGRAKLAVWLLTTTLTAAFAWKVRDALPLVPAIVFCVVSAATVVAGFYVLFLYDEKPSASLIVPDCERDEGCHFDQPLNKYKMEALTTPAEMTTSKKNLTAAKALTVATSAQGA